MKRSLGSIGQVISFMQSHIYRKKNWVSATDVRYSTCTVYASELKAGQVCVSICHVIVHAQLQCRNGTRWENLGYGSRKNIHCVINNNKQCGSGYLAGAGISLEQLFCHNPLSSRWSGPGLPGGWGLWLSQPLIFRTGCYDLPVMSFFNWSNVWTVGVEFVSEMTLYLIVSHWFPVN